MVDEDEPGVSVLLEGGTEESLPELLPPVGSVSPPVTKSSFRSGPSGVVEEELPEDPPEGVELLELDELSELESWKPRGTGRISRTGRTAGIG